MFEVQLPQHTPFFDPVLQAVAEKFTHLLGREKPYIMDIMSDEEGFDASAPWSGSTSLLFKLCTRQLALIGMPCMIAGQYAASCLHSCMTCVLMHPRPIYRKRNKGT